MHRISVDSNSHGIPPFLEVGDEKYSGGEGGIYFTLDRKYAVKIYHLNKIRDIHERKRHLSMVILLGKYLKPEDTEFLGWPLASVHEIDGQNTLGSVSDYIPYAKWLDFSYSPNKAIAQFKAGKSWANYLQIARNIARSTELLHARGVTHTDISYNNFLADIDTGKAVLIDLDSIVVPDFLAVKMIGTTGFMAPEIVLDSRRNPPGELSDRHALAITILYTLLFRNPMQFLKCYDPDNMENDDKIGFGREAAFSENPMDKRNRPSNIGKPLFQGGALSYKILPVPLQKLTERALIDGLFHSEKRPSAREWREALSWAMDELWQCDNCRLHFPYPHWLKTEERSCPFCGKLIDDRIIHSLLYLYDPIRGGEYNYTQRAIVLDNGWKLYEDILEPKSNPPLSRKNEKHVGEAVFDDNEKNMKLINQNEEPWQVRTNSNPIQTTLSKGEVISLLPGTKIRFGQEKRLVIVVE